MKERQRWSAEEDALLRAYVKQYGPREWHLVSQRMNAPLHRDAKSCLERWKNYLKPGIKKGSLTEEEQRLVIRLQAKHGNKWKKIAAEVPGRTAKRLGKWWEVYKEKQQREKKDNSHINKNRAIDPIEERKYDSILETFAEKLVKDRAGPAFLMATASNGGGFLHPDPPPVVHPPPPPPPTSMLPPWLSTAKRMSSSAPARPPSPSVTLSLSSTVAAPPPPTVHHHPWLNPERGVGPGPSQDTAPQHLGLITGLPPVGGAAMAPATNFGECTLVAELVECCRDLEEGHRAWAAHKKEAAWRLKRVELQLESEKANRRREKMEEIEAKVKALREEQRVALDRIEAEYREQLAELRGDAEAKDQKLAEHWAKKHLRISKFLEQIGCRPRVPEPNGH